MVRSLSKACCEGGLPIDVAATFGVRVGFTQEAKRENAPILLEFDGAVDLLSQLAESRADSRVLCAAVATVRARQTSRPPGARRGHAARRALAERRLPEGHPGRARHPEHLPRTRGGSFVRREERTMTLYQRGIRSIGRRLFIRGAAGVLVGLPILETFQPRLASAQDLQHRYALFVRQGNGVQQGDVGGGNGGGDYGSEPDRFWPTKLGSLTTASMQAARSVVDGTRYGFGFRARRSLHAARRGWLFGRYRLGRADRATCPGLRRPPYLSQLLGDGGKQEPGQRHEPRDRRQNEHVSRSPAAARARSNVVPVAALGVATHRGR